MTRANNAGRVRHLTSVEHVLVWHVWADIFQLLDPDRKSAESQRKEKRTEGTEAAGNIHRHNKPRRSPGVWNAEQKLFQRRTKDQEAINEAFSTLLSKPEKARLPGLKGYRS
jgi:hypothetical protein